MTETSETISQQLKGIRKGQRITIHGTYLGGAYADLYNSQFDEAG